MRIFTKILLLVLIGSAICSCSSVVRFSSQGTKTGTNGKNSSSSVAVSEKPEPLPAITKIIRTENMNDIQKDIILEAEKWLGTPYCFGGESKECTDCSGFIQEVFLLRGITLPRTADEQYIYSSKIDDSEKKPGDLIFFGQNNKISHVGLYIGSNEVIHASSSKGVIRQSLDDSYLKSRFAAIGRVLNLRNN